MKISTSTLIAGSIALLFAAEFAPSSPVTLISAAQAVVGRPLSPVSYAGVARRSVYAAPVAYHGAAVATAAVVTTAAVASASAANAQAAQDAAYAQGAAAGAAASQAAAMPAIGTIVATLPEGCTTTAINGIEYNNCAGVYYRATFQGNNLVYVVQSP